MDPNVEVMDQVEAPVYKTESQRLLCPSATAERLKEFAFGVAVLTPTRVMVRETALALKRLIIPMFGNPIYYSPDGMPVDQARNTVVAQALHDGVEWLFFIDYDVAPPPHALVKLLKLNTPISAGVYHLKSIPSWPLIYIKGWPWAFEDYDLGDLIDADGCGMGCTLIHMDVFRKIKPPWFKTSEGYDPETSWPAGFHTEDIYFCNKAKDAGYKVIVDTTIQADHVDWRSGMIYRYIPDPNGGKRGTPGWLYRRNGLYAVETMGDLRHPGYSRAKTAPPKRSKQMIDLGCGPVPAPGFTGIDLHPQSPDIIEGDISDLRWYRERFGLAEAIRSSHSLEHMSHQDVVRIFRDWVNTLQPGGRIEVRVPDGEYHMREFIKRIDEKEDVDPMCDWLNATLFGYQIGKGQEHKTLFTARRLEALANTVGLVDVKVEKKMIEGDKSMMPDTAELVLTARRPEVENCQPKPSQNEPETATGSTSGKRGSSRRRVRQTCKSKRSSSTSSGRK